MIQTENAGRSSYVIQEVNELFQIRVVETVYAVLVLGAPIESTESELKLV